MAECTRRNSTNQIIIHASYSQHAVTATQHRDVCYITFDYAGEKQQIHTDAVKKSCVQKKRGQF